VCLVLQLVALQQQNNREDPSGRQDVENVRLSILTFLNSPGCCCCISCANSTGLCYFVTQLCAVHKPAAAPHKTVLCTGSCPRSCGVHCAAFGAPLHHQSLKCNAATTAAAAFVRLLLLLHSPFYCCCCCLAGLDLCCSATPQDLLALSQHVAVQHGQACSSSSSGSKSSDTKRQPSSNPASVMLLLFRACHHAASSCC
jgi:hypothetical protein